VNGPELRQIGSSVFVIYAASESCSGITFEFSRLKESSDTLTAEVSITSLGAGEIAWSRVNLTSTQGRNALAKEAKETSPEAPWPQVVSEACRMVARHWRRAEPAGELEPAEPNGARYLVDGYIPLGETTILYADGGSGKSLLALAIAVSGIQGHPLSQRWAVGPVQRCLYLDWESDKQTHAERLWGLTTAREQIPKGTILHRRLWRPFTDHLDSIRDDCDRHGIDLVAIDSLAPASGPEPESGDAAVRTLTALRALTATRLVTAHVSKNGSDANGRTRVYGSVFNTNLARSTVEAKLNEIDSGPHRLSIGLRHDKHNLGPRAAPSALAFEWDEVGRITVGGAEPEGTMRNVPDQIRDALRREPLTAQDLADLTGRAPNLIRARLGDMKRAHEVIRLTDYQTGRGNKNLWALADDKRTNE